MLKFLHKLFSTRYKSALVVSGSTDTEEQAKYVSDEAQVIFGIMQIAAEGFDNDRIDTVIYLHPVVDTEQSIGRAIRYAPNKKQPLVFLPLPDCNMYQGIYKKSQQFIEINAKIKKSIVMGEVSTVLEAENYSPY